MSRKQVSEKNSAARKEKPIESLPLFETEDILSTQDDWMKVLLKSAEVDPGDGSGIRRALKVALKSRVLPINNEQCLKDIDRLLHGRNLSFTTMCRVVDALGLQFQLRRKINQQ